MRTIGLIGGMSWESTAVYYRLVNEGLRERLGGLHSARIVLWSVDFAPIAAMQAAGEWEKAADELVQAGQGLRAAGAECIVICTNTMHKLADVVEQEVGLPLIHIADITAEALKASGAARPLLLATRFTMEQSFYRGRMAERHGLDVVVPDEADRAEVHRIIYEELCQGVVTPASKERYIKIVENARRQNVDAVIFGCTEVGLLVSQADFEIPVFDSTALHASAAVHFSLVP
jgi:aspartate racemase